MNKIIKDACILFAITLVAGIVLGAVYNITKGPIAAADEKATNEAYAAVYKDAEFKACGGTGRSSGTPWRCPGPWAPRRSSACRRSTARRR